MSVASSVHKVNSKVYYFNSSRGRAKTGDHLGFNLLGNYIGKFWSIASIYLFVPLYIKYLGIDAFGVIAFHSVILGILFIADGGLSPAFAREVAKSSKKLSEVATLLRSLEMCYMVIILVIVIGISLASGWIATSWLKHSQKIPISVLQTSIILMGAIAAIQVAMSLYNAGLMGAEYHATANLLQIGFSMTRSGLVILPIYFYPNLLVFFSWQLVTSAFFLILMRRTVRRKLGLDSSGRFSTEALRSIGKFALGMLGIAVISALNTHMDKLVLSKMLSLQDLGRYTLAGMLAQAPSIITLPIAVSLLPRLTRWVIDRQHEQLIASYHRFSYIIASIATTTGFVVALNPFQLINCWTGNPSLSVGLDLTVRILVFGHVMLALQYMPYHLALANGHSKTSLIIGSVFVVISPFLLVLLINQIGISGAAIPWLLMNTSVAILLATLILRRFLSGQFIKSWLTGFGAPIVITSICTGLIQWLWFALGISSDYWMWKIVALVITCCVSCLVVYLLLFSRVRNVEYLSHST